MGFHLASRVYEEIKGTTSTEQAILAFLAFRANDKTGACFPSQKTIEACTHFRSTAIGNALNSLRAKNILTWKKGGRLTGKGGKSLANSYTINFDEQHTNNQQANGKLINISATNQQSDNLSSPRQTGNAVPTKRVMQSPPDGQCSPRQAGNIIKNHNKNHTSLIMDTASRLDVNSDLCSKAAELGKEWAKKQKPPPNLKKAEEPSLVELAMEVCHVNKNDYTTNRNLQSAMLSKNRSAIRDRIDAFESEIEQGEHKGARCLAAILIKRIQELPDAS